MTLYHVHIYREMRLKYERIEAASPEEAAEFARHLPSEHATLLDDCDGDTLSALVDVADDDQFRQSRMIDFECERLRKAAAELLEALEEALREIAYWHGDMLSEEERNHPRGSGWARVHDKGRAAIAKVKGEAA